MRILALSLSLSLMLLSGCSPSRPAALAMSQEGDVITFEASSVEHLGLPLQEAFSDALDKPSISTFRLKLAAGEYRDFALTLEQPPDSKRQLTLIVEGDNGQAVFRQSPLKFAAQRLVLKNLTMTETTAEGATLQIKVGESFSAEHVSLVDNVSAGHKLPDPIVSMTVGFASRSALALWQSCWFVGNRAEGLGALIETPKVGPGTFESLTFKNSVFANNTADALLAPWFSRQVSIHQTVSHDTSLRLGGVSLRSPLVKVKVSDSLLVTSPDAFHFISSPDVKRDDFPPVALENTAIFSKNLPRASDFARDPSSTLKTTLPRRSNDWRTLALDAKTPDFKALTSQLK